MVVLAAVVLVVENYLESIQQAVLQVHLDKVTQVGLALVVVVVVKQQVAVVALALLVLLLQLALVVMVDLEVHRALLVLQ
jgi:hypothetical protein